jgi:hypothetical protein
MVKKAAEQPNWRLFATLIAGAVAIGRKPKVLGAKFKKRLVQEIAAGMEGSDPVVKPAKALKVTQKALTKVDKEFRK